MYDVISKKNKWNSLIFSDVCYCFEIADFELLMNSVVKINQFWQIYFEISKEIENTKFVGIVLNDFQHRFVRNPKKYKMCDTKMEW